MATAKKKETMSPEAVTESLQQGVEQTVDVTRDNIEAAMEATNVAVKGFEQINAEVLAYTKESIEQTVEATKNIMASRTFQEALGAQNDFARAAFDRYVNHAVKLNTLFTETAKDAFSPFGQRVNAIATEARKAA